MKGSLSQAPFSLLQLSIRLKILLYLAGFDTSLSADRFYHSVNTAFVIQKMNLAISLTRSLVLSTL